MFHSFILAVAVANGPVLIARGSPRCNDVIATQLGDQLRGFEKKPVKSAALDDRFAALKTVISQDDTEMGILSSVCPDNDMTPLRSQLEATRAWAIALESDIATAEYQQDCPAEVTPVVSGFLAEAWLHAVKATPDGAAPNELTKLVLAKVSTRAAAVSLKLPAAAETSQYWMSTVQDAGRAAAKACPPPK